MKTLKIKNISVSIDRKPADVYQFISNPLNLPKWASGLSGSIKNVDGEWLAVSPMGRVKIKFAETNGFGVVDHDVTLESGTKFYNPMRVLPNLDGSEVLFTLYRQPGTTEEKFIEDVEWIKRDLEKLKIILEK